MRGKENRYLKWDNKTIGLIHEDNSVTFSNPCYNQVVRLYTQGETAWDSEKFTAFLAARIISRERRDIEKILFRLGLTRYNVLAIADITRAIHPKDLLWIAGTETETFDSAITGVFASVFHQRIDITGKSLDSPEGCNIKRYGVYNNHYGIYKQRLNPLSTDAESERAVYLLAEKIGCACCPVFRTGADTVFSVFQYDFSREYIVHFRHLFEGFQREGYGLPREGYGLRSENEYHNLISLRPQYKNEIIKMLVLDFITRQDDRHLSNMAVKIRSIPGADNYTETFYPLYDNGRSLFYEDTEETVQKAVADIGAYASSFGPEGTYWDHLQEIRGRGVHFRDLVNLDFTKDEIAAILTEAGFSGYRFEGSLDWICKAAEMLE
ncbi:hypothetical protein FACS1894151_08010 [Spirochaetia bacterium]|nr:hypothetical protein FACS1894151_08010 [Spirochaetia bacterium]